MKKTILFLIIGWFIIQMQAQNSIGLQVGFLGTHTSIAEYYRIGRTDFLLDSVSLKTNVGSFQAAINADINLGKNLFLSTGFHYSEKGLANVTFIDSTGWPWTTPARQHYIGLSLLIGYHLHFKQSRYSMQFATGLQSDFSVGTPNGGALFSGPLYRFITTFSSFHEVDLTWATEAGVRYNLGPGEIVAKLTFLFGLSDVMADAYIVGRSMSYGISVGYAFRL